MERFVLNLSTAQVEYSEDQQAMLKVRGRGGGGEGGSWAQSPAGRVLYCSAEQCVAGHHGWGCRVSLSRSGGHSAYHVGACHPVTATSEGWVEHWSQGCPI